MAASFSVLENRAVLRISGADARTFLQAIVTQDIDRVDASHAAYGALLSPQGKFLHEFCIVELGGDIHFDCEAARADDLASRLSRYRLRAAVEIEVRADLAILAIHGDDGGTALGLDGPAGAATSLDSGIAFTDPRRAELGWRAILVRDTAVAALTAAGLEAGTRDEYERARIALAVPDGSRDIEVDRALLLEANFDTLNAIDWDKGCYIGQELTARTNYRGLVRKRLCTVALDGAAPPPGTAITADGREVGTIYSSHEGHAIALLRLDAAEATLSADDVAVRVIASD